MLRKSLIAAVACLSLAPALRAQQTTDSVYTVEVKDADKYRVETNRFGANWFAGIGAGAQMYFGDHDRQMRFVDRITLTSKLTSVSGSLLALVSVLVLMVIRSRVFLVGRVTTSLLP